MTGAILAPTINYGMSHHHESFPGTVTLRPATFVAVVRDVAASLSGAGFTHVLFVNGRSRGQPYRVVFGRCLGEWYLLFARPSQCSTMRVCVVCVGLSRLGT